VKLIWTKSSSPLSILIRWALNEPCSHVAIVFDNKIVFHSNLLGLHIEWFNTFKKKIDIVLEKDFPMPLAEEEALYQSIINKEDGKSYDFKAFFYFTWRALLRKFFKVPLPEKNEWDNPACDICIESIRYLQGYLSTELPSDQRMSIMTPYELALILAAQPPKQQDQ
jgi:hypothetical protein